MIISQVREWKLAAFFVRLLKGPFVHEHTKLTISIQAKANPSKSKNRIVDCLALNCLCYSKYLKSLSTISNLSSTITGAFLTVSLPPIFRQRRHHDDQVRYRSLYSLTCHDRHQRPAWWTSAWWPPGPWPGPPPRPLLRRQFCRPVQCLH